MKIPYNFTDFNIEYEKDGGKQYYFTYLSDK
jgi:hypothetical protein